MSMPWHVSKSESCPETKPYAVITNDSGKTHGCHATRQGALKQLAVLYVKQKRGEIAGLDELPRELWEEIMQTIKDS